MGLIGKGLGKILGAILGVAAAAGTVAAVDGAVKTKKAKELNNQAKQIESNALSNYEKAHDYADSQLLDLGKSKKTAIDFFPWFSELLEKIQDRPNFRGQYDEQYKLQQLDINEIQTMSEGLRVALAGAAGAGAGALIGLAAFGPSAIIAAPAIAVGGFVICAKGNKMYQEAKRNKEKALELEDQINKLIPYLHDVATYSNSLSRTFLRVNSYYYRYLKNLETVLKHKTNWKDFTKEEKKATKCCVLLTRLLTEMCKVEIVQKGRVERVNIEDVRKVQDDVYNLLPKLSKI